LVKSVLAGAGALGYSAAAAFLTSHLLISDAVLGAHKAGHFVCMYREGAVSSSVM
jgi:hypothetical protein